MFFSTSWKYTENNYNENALGHVLISASLIVARMMKLTE
jgi:hypothetical protein